tara:strand:+ start:490 stop:945 length:456 start_codon:yes stop_codon:yes gene_type:complete
MQNTEGERNHLSTGVFKLAKLFGGCGYYAKVTVEASPGKGLVSLSPDVFAWLKDVYGPEAWEWPVCDSYREAAMAGATYALAHMDFNKARHDISVTQIHVSPVDTNWDSVAYAACHATWKAAGAEGTEQPHWEGRSIVFPGGLNRPAPPSS